MTPTSAPARRDWLTDAGLLVAALAAITSSGAALAGLARLAGWPTWLALMLPATIDLYAITATRVWLSRRTMSIRMRRYAAANALAGIGASVAGNAVYHAIVADAVHLPRWVLVIVVSMVPPIVIGALAHLVALRTRETDHRLATASRTTPRKAVDRTDTRSGADHSTRTTRARTTRAPDQSRPGAREPVASTSKENADQLDAAVAAYRANVEHGDPLSERKLAERYGQSRRWARKVIDAARDGDGPDSGAEQAQDDSASRPHLALAKTEVSGGAQ